MPLTPTFDRKALMALLDKQHGVVSRVQTFESGRA